MYCRKCGAEIKDETARICSRCGAELKQKYTNFSENHPEDNLIWDDGLPEVPDNRGDNGEKKKWLVSIGITVAILVVTAVVLLLLLGNNFSGSDSDIVVNITQAPKAKTSQSTTTVARTSTDKATVTPTPANTRELQLTSAQNTESKNKQISVQPSKETTVITDSQVQQPQEQTVPITVQGETDKDLEALRNVPVQEYVMPEENTADTTTVDNTGTGDYIFPQSNSEYLTRDLLEGLSKDQLAYARNEIYARHGRTFRDQMFQDYFNSKSWYVPQYDPDTFDAIQDTVFNDYEKENARLILDVEKEHGYTY